MLARVIIANEARALILIRSTLRHINSEYPVIAKSKVQNNIAEGGNSNGTMHVQYPRMMSTPGATWPTQDQKKYHIIQTTEINRETERVILFGSRPMIR